MEKADGRMGHSSPVAPSAFPSSDSVLRNLLWLIWLPMEVCI